MVKKLIIGGFILLLGASWAWNLWLHRSQQLDRPIFLQHYYEIPSGMVQEARFYYISNIGSDRKPVQMELPGYAMLRVDHDTVRDQHGRLQNKELVIGRADPVPIVEGNVEQALSLSEPRSFTHVKVYYSDGVVEEVPIGELRVVPQEEGEGALSGTHGKSSSDGTGEQHYLAQRDIEFLSVSSSFEDILGDTLQVEFNERDAADAAGFPSIRFKGDPVSVKYKLQFSDEDTRRYHAYQINLYAETREGRKERLATLYEQPRLYGEDIYRYVRERKGGLEP